MCEKKIWIFNHYATGMYFKGGGRHQWIAQNLIESGYHTEIFSSAYRNQEEERVDTGDDLSVSRTGKKGVIYTFVKTPAYFGNGLSRVRNMYSYFRNVKKICSRRIEAGDRPDVIIGSSVHPLALVAAVQLGKKYDIPCICEVRDLWPLGIVAYSSRLTDRNPLIRLLYMGERWIYKSADQLVFTMEGCKQYVIDKGWDKDSGGPVDLNKVHYINNGVDLEEFNYNREHYHVDNPDLYDDRLKRIVYTGSVRKANESVVMLPEVARKLAELVPEAKIIVYGKGDMVDTFSEQCRQKGIDNISFNHAVEKKYVPFILEKAHVEILNCKDSGVISNYGGSQNKLFEYLASGKPIITGELYEYSIIMKNGCGIARQFDRPEEVAFAIKEILDNYDEYAFRSGEVIKEYDFRKLTDKYIEIIEKLIGQTGCPDQQERISSNGS